ncbi:MAG: T9SS type A sorting domain-containing protein, partial [Ignavibacteria bacterium]|nr:T9SS type A sorting domain-containing protein [Ignavibacteria bacterium]
ISEPKNENIYGEQIPIEIFTTEDVRSFTIVANDSTVLTQNVSSNYFGGNLSLKLIEQIKDLELTFHFFDASGIELKSEAISVLCSMKQLQLPEIKMQLVPSSLNPGSKNYLLIDITNDSLFTIEGNKIDYVVHPHIGFDEGTAKSRVITLLDNKYSFTDYFDIPKETKAATFGAGFTIRHGKFTKRIFSQLILTHGTWANPIKATDVITHIDDFKSGTGETFPETQLFQNSPNPFNPETTISYKLQAASQVSLKVYDVLGNKVATLVNEFKQPGVYNSTFYTLRSSLTSGVYFYTLKAGSHVESKKMLLVK